MEFFSTSKLEIILTSNDLCRLQLGMDSRHWSGKNAVRL